MPFSYLCIFLQNPTFSRKLVLAYCELISPAASLVQQDATNLLRIADEITTSDVLISCLRKGSVMFEIEPGRLKRVPFIRGGLPETKIAFRICTSLCVNASSEMWKQQLEGGIDILFLQLSRTFALQ